MSLHFHNNRIGHLCKQYMSLCWGSIYRCNGYGFLVCVLSYRTLRFDSGESMHTRNSLRGIYFLMIFLFGIKQLKTKVKTELVKVFYKSNVSILNLE